MNNTPEASAPADSLGTNNYTVSIGHVTDWTAVAEAWTTLERDAEPSFFLSWRWIGCWVNQLRPSAEPLLLRVEEGDRVVGLGLLVEHTGWRRGFVHSRRLLLHESGDAGLDRIFIEHNGVLTRPGLVSAVTAAALRDLEAMGRWDEIVLSGVTLSSRAGADPLRLRLRERSVDAPFVDLAAVRRRGGDYLAMLGKNTRYAIRRSLKLYGERGEVRIHAAKTAEEALSYFERLGQLHQRYWTSRGKPGVFSEPAFRRFHSNLLASRFDPAEIQLLHATAGDTTIGYLYNFRKHGRIYQYMSGLSYDGSKKLKPGLVSHCLAVQASLEDGADAYDFLAGDDRYKRNLATDAQPMLWLTLQRDAWWFQLEHTLLHTWRRLRSR